jgi:hypothetical protein
MKGSDILHSLYSYNFVVLKGFRTTALMQTNSIVSCIAAYGLWATMLGLTCKNISCHLLLVLSKFIHYGRFIACVLLCI